MLWAVRENQLKTELTEVAIPSLMTAPLLIQLIAAWGLLIVVVQERVRLSPTLTSSLPVMVTASGATAIQSKTLLVEPHSFWNFLKPVMLACHQPLTQWFGFYLFMLLISWMVWHELMITLLKTTMIECWHSWFLNCDITL